MPTHRNYARYGAETTFYEDIDDYLTSPVSQDIQSIRYDKHTFELLIVNNNAPTTIVIFHAAVNPAQTSLPVFVGRHLTEGIQANLVFVSDPALQYGPSIGWFAGSEEIPVQQDLVAILSHIQQGIPEANHLVLFGASAGGFAALNYAHCFPNSLAIVANPQTSIAGYHPAPVKDYLSKCWSGRPFDELEIKQNLVESYRHSFPCYVIYLQNSRDDFHISGHFAPWKAVADSHPAKWRLHMDDWGPGHAPVPPALLTGIMAFAVSVDGEWAEIFEDDLFD